MKLLKMLYWDLKEKDSRFFYLHYMLMNLPGSFGVELRRRFFVKYFKSCGENVYIGEGARFRGISRLEVGNNVSIGVHNFIQASGGVTLGNDVLLGPGVKIWTLTHKYDDIATPIHAQGYLNAPVIIGNGVWVGADVFVLPGVNLPEGCVVSAGSIVNKKAYPPYSIIAGNPARVIGSRKATADRSA